MLKLTTHCTTTKRVFIANFELAGSSLSRKHDLATFEHKRLNWTWTLCSQSRPLLDTEWLYEDVNGYKIINIYKPPQRDCKHLTYECFLTQLFTLMTFNSTHTERGYNNNTADGYSLTTCANFIGLALLYNRKDTDLYNPKDPNSYHPISLLCVSYKILSMLIHACVKPIINPLLLAKQSGFRRWRSTMHQADLLTQKIEDCFEAKRKAVPCRTCTSDSGL